MTAVAAILIMRSMFTKPVRFIGIAFVLVFERCPRLRPCRKITYPICQACSVQLFVSRRRRGFGPDSFSFLDLNRNHLHPLAN